MTRGAVMEPKKKITFDDIARYTNFSKTTISRYFNNPDSLAPESQRIISDALEKLHYKENKVARILANGQTEFIGIILPESTTGSSPRCSTRSCPPMRPTATNSWCSWATEE